MNERLDLSAIMMCPLWKFTYLAGGIFQISIRDYMKSNMPPSFPPPSLSLKNLRSEKPFFFSSSSFFFFSRAAFSSSVRSSSSFLYFQPYFYLKDTEMDSHVISD